MKNRKKKIIGVITPVLTALSLCFLMTGCGAGDMAKETSSSLSELQETREETTTITESEKMKETETKSETATESKPETVTEQLKICIGEQNVLVELEENETTTALKELLANGELKVTASNYGGFEKILDLPETLPSNDTQTQTKAGDVMLYSGNKIVIFYEPNSWAYTTIGHVEGTNSEVLTEILSGDEAEAVLSIEGEREGGLESH